LEEMKMALIFRQEKGHLGQYEDWWYLDQNADGTHTVRHRWDHVTVNGLGKNDGENSYTVDEFLAGDHHGTAKQKLREALGL
jgi:hypothetical protein